jgi:glucose/arabinose dehydrogenase
MSIVRFRLFHPTLLFVIAWIGALAVRADEATVTPEQKEKAIKAIKVPPGYKYEILAMGNLPEPVFLKFGPDGRLWYTGRRGNIWAYDFKTQKSDEVATLKVCWEPIPGRESNERGLHGIEFDPDYAHNGQIYVYYSPVYDNAWSNRVARFTVDNPSRASGLKSGSEKVLLEWISSKGFHQGGALAYNSHDGKLYVTVGDNNVSGDTEKFYNDPKNPPQVLSDLRGKVLRINLDGSIPKDNPFVGQADAHPAVFTWGHRNPYSINLDPENGRVYVGEVGYDRKEDFEEINYIQAGHNYGWPRCIGPNIGTYGGDCPIPNATLPWIYWIHEGGANATSGPLYRPTGGTNDFPKDFHGGMFYADYVRRWVRFAPVDAGSNTVLKTQPFATGFTGGILAMTEGPDGGIYLAEYGGWFTPSPQDKISRIVPVHGSN